MLFLSVALLGTAHAAELDPLPLSAMRNIAAQVEEGETHLARQRRVAQSEISQLNAEAARLERLWTSACPSARTAQRRAACRRVLAQHRAMQARSLRTRADVWRDEASWHQQVQQLWDRAARRAVAQRRTYRQSPAAERSLLGDHDLTRRAQTHLRELEQLKAQVQRRLDDAARSAGITEPVSLALARRAAQSRLLAAELARGAQILDALALMVEVGDVSLDTVRAIPSLDRWPPARRAPQRSTTPTYTRTPHSSCGRS